MPTGPETRVAKLRLWSMRVNDVVPVWLVYVLLPISVIAGNHATLRVLFLCAYAPIVVSVLGMLVKQSNRIDDHGNLS